MGDFNARFRFNGEVSYKGKICWDKIIAGAFRHQALLRLPQKSSPRHKNSQRHRVSSRHFRHMLPLSGLLTTLNKQQPSSDSKKAANTSEVLNQSGIHYSKSFKHTVRAKQPKDIERFSWKPDGHHTKLFIFFLVKTEMSTISIWRRIFSFLLDRSLSHHRRKGRT